MNSEEKDVWQLREEQFDREGIDMLGEFNNPADFFEFIEKFHHFMPMQLEACGYTKGGHQRPYKNFPWQIEPKKYLKRFKGIRKTREITYKDLKEAVMLPFKVSAETLQKPIGSEWERSTIKQLQDEIKACERSSGPQRMPLVLSLRLIALTARPIKSKEVRKLVYAFVRKNGQLETWLREYFGSEPPFSVPYVHGAFDELNGSVNYKPGWITDYRFSILRHVHRTGPSRAENQNLYKFTIKRALQEQDPMDFFGTSVSMNAWPSQGFTVEDGSYD